MVCAALHNYIERAQVPPPMNLVAHVPTTNPTRGGRPSGLVNQGAAGAMRAHLAKHVASKLNLRPVTYSPPEYRSLMHGPVMPQNLFFH